METHQGTILEFLHKIIISYCGIFKAYKCKELRRTKTLKRLYNAVTKTFRELVSPSFTSESINKKVNKLVFM